MSTSFKQNCLGVIRLIPLLFCLGMAASNAMGEENTEEGFVVKTASTELHEGVYRLNAKVDYGLSKAALDALDSGVPLVVEMEIEIFRPRKWIWNETVAKLNQRYSITYHALSKQYIITNLNNKVQQSFFNRNSALAAMGQVTGLPLLDKRLLDNGQKYQARVRTSLLINELPTPMRPWAYISGDWRLVSEWFIWPIN
jgi:hypothetical protein